MQTSAREGLEHAQHETWGPRGLASMPGGPQFTTCRASYARHTRPSLFTLGRALQMRCLQPLQTKQQAVPAYNGNLQDMGSGDMGGCRTHGASCQMH
eukprot:scaffold37637_cov40-Tisochrysis_lutea.AAC.10